MITSSTTKNIVEHPDNQVLQDSFRTSKNFFESDKILQHLLKRDLSADGHNYIKNKLHKLGQIAARKMDSLSMLADKNGPELAKRDAYGNTIDKITFHPSYWELMKIAVESDMFRTKWQPHLRQRFQRERHRLGFASNFIYGMAEGGIPCPLCMTDGAARLIDKYAEQADKQRLLPRIYTQQASQFFTGAMFLTEKAGGSDVGANLVTATHHQGKYYLLNGEKWFCSNANADIIFVLARTNSTVKGTKGLSIFLVEKKQPNGMKNPMEIVRLKDKLGVRSMASAECILTNTWGKLIGAEGQGFKIMAEMINLSRLYNAVGSISGFRRCLIEAYQFLNHRKTFGKIAINHALIKEKLAELSASYTANFYLTWKAIRLLDQADNGNAISAHLLRLVTPMVKRSAAIAGVYGIRESMELMGGLGYIEDTVMPKFMRDTMVLPIWEGAGNIMILDMLRAAKKSRGFMIMTQEISQRIKGKKALEEALKEVITIVTRMQHVEQDTIEVTAKYVFERLTTLYQISVLLEYRDEVSKGWIDTALTVLLRENQQKISLQKPFSLAQIKESIAWEA